MDVMGPPHAPSYSRVFKTMEYDGGDGSGSKKLKHSIMQLGGALEVFPEARLREPHDPNHKIQVVCSLSLDSGKPLSVP